MNNASGNAAPTARKKPVKNTVHGIERTDPYAWLRADNWQEVMRDPSVLEADIGAYLESENAYAKSTMADTDDLQATLFAEMKGRIKEDDSSVPAPDGDYAYGIEYETGAQHPKMMRMARDGSNKQCILDGNALAEGKAYFQLGGSTHSPDHSLLAWAADDKGSEFYTLKFRDLGSGNDLADEISETGGGGVWSADNRDVFYVRLDENHRPSQVYRHRIGTAPADDVLVYEETDAGFFVSIGKTQSGRFIVIDCHDHETSECYLIDADAPEAAPRLVAAREPGTEYSLDEGDGTLYFLTNADDAEDFKVVIAPTDTPGRENWRDLIVHAPGTLVLAVTVYKDHLVRLERVEGLPRIVIRRLSDNTEHVIAFDEEAYSLGLLGGYEFDTRTLRFSYSSMTTPSQVFDYDMETHERTLRKTQEVPSGHDPDNYVTRRVMAPAGDGELVPVSLLYHKDTPLDGSAPCWLYGYGAYGISMPASFSTARLSLVERGFVFAMAHIRGGKDKGYRWYTHGKRDKKVNTFTDFIAAGRYLCGQQFTSAGKITAHGGSAGGMLMGAVANMAPELFKAIVAEVPFVDVLNTMLDDTLPLTPPEWPEWGNPIASEADYRLIASYSPYDNVEAKDYPHILAMAGLTDPRVTYWEPAKWVARLRELKTNNNHLLLKTNMDAGHGGASGRFDHLKEIAFVYAFGLKVNGLPGRPA